MLVRCRLSLRLLLKLMTKGRGGSSRPIARESEVGRAHGAGPWSLPSGEPALHQRELESYREQGAAALEFLAGGVAHDVNNPLTVILGMTQLLLESPRLPAQRRALLEQIEAAAERAAQLTRRLLEFSRKRAAAPAVLDLRRTIDDYLGILQRLAGERVRLELSSEPALWCVRLSRFQVEQCLTQLTLSACDAMPRGGVLRFGLSNLELASFTVRGGARVEPGQYVQLSAGDTSEGLDEQAIQQAFEPFYTTDAKGAGLGLALVRSLLLQCGGNIWVESQLGEGSTFHLLLPVDQGPEAAPFSEVRPDRGA
jgi:two-component system, cell cycle sensor histidine kinase and response regulator CckA